MNRKDEILFETVISPLGLMESSNYCNLSENEKADMMNILLSRLFGLIKDRLISVDTAVIDASRGSFDKIRGIDNIHRQLDVLERLYEGTNYTIKKGEIKAVRIAISYLRTFEGMFNQSYRNQTTMGMLFYKAISIALIMEINYLWSISVDISDNGQYLLKKDIQDTRATYITTIIRFIDFAKSGTMKMIFENISVLREAVDELPREISIYESSMLNTLVTKGMDFLHSKFLKDKSTLAYKVAGIAIILIAIRELVYAISQSKTKIGDVIEKAKNIIYNPSPAMNRQSQMFALDAEESFNSAHNDIKYENKGILNSVNDLGFDF